MPPKDRSKPFFSLPSSRWIPAVLARRRRGKCGQCSLNWLFVTVMSDEWAHAPALAVARTQPYQLRRGQAILTPILVKTLRGPHPDQTKQHRTEGDVLSLDLKRCRQEDVFLVGVPPVH